MRKVTLKFPSLHLLGECLFLTGAKPTVIDYDECTLTATLSEADLQIAKNCHGVVTDNLLTHKADSEQ